MSFFQFPLFIILFLTYKCSLFKTIHNFNPEHSTIPLGISKELKKIIHDLTPKETIIGKPIVAFLSTNIISADKGKPIKMDLPFENGDIGTDIMEMLYISKQDTIFSIKKYNIQYFLNPLHIINTLNITLNTMTSQDNKEDEFLVNCSYSITDNKFTLTNYKTKAFAKYLRTSFITIGLSKESGKLVSISYNDTTIINKELYLFEKTTEYLKTSFIIDFSLIDQHFINEVYLCIRTKENSIMIYEIEMNQPNFTLTLVHRIENQNLIDINDTVVKIGKIDNIYILLTTKRGLMKVFQNENQTKWIIGDIGNEKKYKYLDFVVCTKALYAIVEGIGLVIYKISDYFSTNQILYHKSMKSIDFFINPFYGNKFIGITMEPSSSSTELFLELLINDELHPIVNKNIVSSPTRNFLPIYTLDNFFSYFYDVNSNEMFLVRRGLLSSVPFITYKLSLSNKQEINDTIITISSLYDTFSDTHIISLIANETIYIIKDVELAKHNINCTFNKQGIYNVTFIQHGEVCANSLQNASVDNHYVTCQKIVSYNFNIYEADNTAVSIVFGICCGFIFFVFISLLCILTCNTKCFRKIDKLKLVEVDKSHKKEIYSTESTKETETLKLSQNEKKGNDISIINKLNITEKSANN